jgi:hypothetical protein
MKGVVDFGVKRLPERKELIRSGCEAIGVDPVPLRLAVPDVAIDIVRECLGGHIEEHQPAEDSAQQEAHLEASAVPGSSRHDEKDEDEIQQTEESDPDQTNRDGPVEKKMAKDSPR